MSCLKNTAQWKGIYYYPITIDIDSLIPRPLLVSNVVCKGLRSELRGSGGRVNIMRGIAWQVWFRVIILLLTRI